MPANGWCVSLAPEGVILALDGTLNHLSTLQAELLAHQLKTHAHMARVKEATE